MNSLSQGALEQALQPNGKISSKASIKAESRESCIFYSYKIGNDPAEIETIESLKEKLHRYEFAIAKAKIILLRPVEQYEGWLKSDPSARLIKEVEIPLFECMRLGLNCLDAVHKERPCAEIEKSKTSDCDFLSNFAKPCSRSKSSSTAIDEAVAEILKRQTSETPTIDTNIEKCETKQCHACDDLKRDIASLASFLSQERASKDRLAASRNILDCELEELTSHLFEQANELVGKEVKLRKLAETELLRITGKEAAGCKSPINSPDLAEFRNHITTLATSTSDFMKRSIKEDIEPCLYPQYQSSAKPSSAFRKELMQACNTSSIQLDLINSSTACCANCGTTTKCEYKIKLLADHAVCCFCTQRIMSVSEFFLFVNNVSGKSGNILELFKKALFLKKRMSEARIGSYGMMQGVKESWENITI
jgi:hypothetical protein